jgi:hypothetical protein
MWIQEQRALPDSDTFPFRGAGSWFLAPHESQKSLQFKYDGLLPDALVGEYSEGNQRLIVERAEREKREAESKREEEIRKKKKDEPKDPQQNAGTLLMDATVIPEVIRYPHDVTLLDEARQETEKIIDTMHEKSKNPGNKARTY